MQKKIKWIKFGIFAAISLAAFIIGIVGAATFGVGYSDESVHTVFVESEDDLRAMGDSFYNNICYLENDITVSELSVLADERHPFVGVFDGQGHTVTLTGSAAVKSLFGYIGEGGVVRNLHIVVEEATLANRATSATLALVNEGLIQNCRVTVKRMAVELRGHYGAVVGVNEGTVEHTFAEVSFVGTMSATERESSSKLVLAAGVAFNKGTVDTVIATVRYTDIDEADGNLVANTQSGIVNRGVGAVVGNNNDGTVKNAYALTDAGVHLYDAHIAHVTVASTNIDEVYSVVLLFDTLNFDDQIWVLRNREPLFIQGV